MIQEKRSNQPDRRKSSICVLYLKSILLRKCALFNGLWNQRMAIIFEARSSLFRYRAVVAVAGSLRMSIWMHLLTLIGSRM